MCVAGPAGVPGGEGTVTGFRVSGVKSVGYLAISGRGILSNSLMLAPQDCGDVRQSPNCWKSSGAFWI